jgi:hypothetical protein
MAGVAAGGLRGLEEVGLIGTEGDIVKLAVEGELTRGVGGGGGVSATGNLHIDTVQTALSSYKRGGAEQRFIAEDAEFYLTAIEEGCGHGGDAVFEEDEVGNLFAGSFDVETKREAHRVKVKANDDIGAEGTKKSVAVDEGHGMPCDPDG